MLGGWCLIACPSSQIKYFWNLLFTWIHIQKLKWPPGNFQIANSKRCSTKLFGCSKQLPIKVSSSSSKKEVADREKKKIILKN